MLSRVSHVGRCSHGHDGNNNCLLGLDVVIVKQRHMEEAVGYPTCAIREHITSFRSITMFYGTDNILHNTSSFTLNVRNVMWNIVKPTKHCCGSE